MLLVDDGRGRDSEPKVMDRIWDFCHKIMRGSATEEVPVRGGFAVLNAEFPTSYEHNCLALKEVLDPPFLMAEADRILGGAGLGHRAIEVEVEGLEVSWLERFRAAGYLVHPTAVMALQRPSERRRDTPVERVGYEELMPAMEASWRHELPHASEDSIRQLVARRTATGRACAVTHHVVRAAGRIVAHCDLYRIPPIAQVETVETDPEWRNRGYATAVVLDAVELAHESACDLTFLMAAADDWPQHLYERLGFARVGGACTLQRPAPA